MAKLFFKYGAMNSGKSTMIIQTAYNYEEKKRKVMLIKSILDTKGDNYIVNRTNLKRKVDLLLKQDDTIMHHLKTVDVILVDEAQFLTKKQVDELYYITKTLDIPVLCYGLRCDFRMQGFPGATRLLEIADQIEEIKNICECGHKATQNIRFVNNEAVFEGGQVAIDGKDNVTYSSVCGKCYIEYYLEYKRKQAKKHEGAYTRSLKK